MIETILNNKIKPLINIQLKNKFLQKKAIIGIIILSVMAFIKAITIINNTSSNGIEINTWDMFNTIINNGFFVFGVYTPILIVITGVFQKRDSSIMNILIRAKDKREWVISNIIATLITAIVINTILYIIFFLISIIFTKYSANWSEFILNTTDFDASSYGLCERGFVTDYSPIQVILLSYLFSNLGILAVIFFRDLLVEQAASLKVANLIIIIGLFLNTIFIGSVATILYNKLRYITITHMFMFGYHNFGYKKEYCIFTVNQSLSIAIVIILLTLFLRIKLSKRMVIKNEI